jgi:Flp pilus assembly protein TadD
LQRGNAKFELKNFKGAIEDYNKGITIDPKNANLYLARGVVRYGSGQKDLGCLDLNKAKELGSIQANEVINKYCK